MRSLATLTPSTAWSAVSCAAAAPPRAAFETAASSSSCPDIRCEFCSASTEACVLVVAFEELSCASADGAKAKASAKVATKVRSVSEDFIYVSLSLRNRNFQFHCDLETTEWVLSEALFKTIVGAVIFVQEKISRNTRADGCNYFARRL